MPTKFFICIILLAILASCSFKKRLYTKGFYADRSNAIKKPESIAKTDTLRTVKVKVNDLKLKLRNVKLIASNSDFIIPHSTLTQGCDTIILQNGVKIIGSITGMKRTKIYFKNCDSTNYSSSSIDKKDINHINFSNGNIQFSDFKTNNAGDKINVTALAGFILSLLALFFLILFMAGVSSNPFSAGLYLLFIALLLYAGAVITSILALVQITMSDINNRKGLVLAIISIIISLAFIGLLLFHFR